MPIYEFVCGCGYTTEEFLEISKRNTKKLCPECGTILSRLIGGGQGFIFKGSGFYSTDYPKKEGK